MPNTTQNLIDAIAARHGGATDYRVAKIMGWTPQAVSSYRTGRSQLDNRGLLQRGRRGALHGAD
jgi:predicted transcriptional regulator